MLDIILYQLQDTNVILWDVVNETGMFRLKGHKDSITQCYFLDNANVIITRY